MAKGRVYGKADQKVQEISDPVDSVDFDDDTSTSASEADSDEAPVDVSKKGLARLMKALGDDGLSELDRAHLSAVTGADQDGEDEDEDDEDEDGESLEEVDSNASEEDDNEDEESHSAEPSLNKPKNSASNGDSLAASIARSGLVEEEIVDDEDEDEDEEDDEESAVPVDSISDAAFAKLPESVRSSRTYREKVNNEDALRRIRDGIALSKRLPWVESLVVPYEKSIQSLVGEEAGAADDDLKRELEFYRQALHSATSGRTLASQANLPFTRPSDYFAEMVKSDEHMERVRQRLLDDRAGLKAAEEARKQRELKKFGKKVQVEKQLERQRNKREFEDKVKGLKRKHQGGLDGTLEDDDFDVGIDSAVQSGPGKSQKGRGKNVAPKMKREARNAKFGFGGKKRHMKENTKESTNDFGGSKSKSRGNTAKRPGKARRHAKRS